VFLHAWEVEAHALPGVSARAYRLSKRRPSGEKDDSARSGGMVAFQANRLQRLPVLFGATAS